MLKKARNIVIRRFGLFVSIVCVLLLIGCQSPSNNSTNISLPLHGVTIDDSWDDTPTNRNAIINTLKSSPVRLTVRIVMDTAVKPRDYVELFKAIHETAYIMACPVDSTDMLEFTTVDTYKKRFEDSVEALSRYVDLWEIANEISGEGPNTGEGTLSDPDWLGNGDAARQLNADKMYAAYKYVSGLGLKTVMTPYLVFPGYEFSSTSPTMMEWLETYVPADMKKGIHFVMVSYYEDDNDGKKVDWESIFKSLETMFPYAYLGVGECGNVAATATKTSKIEMIEYYYGMIKYVSRFVGGFFWWNWVQDCVIDNSQTGKDILKAMYDKMVVQP